MTESLFEFVLGIIFMVSGLVFIILVSINLYYNEKTKNWNFLKGKILNSNLVKKETNYSLDIDEYGPSTEVTYNQIIDFEYEFEDNRYSSNKLYYLNFNNWFTSNKMKKSLDKKYEKGEIVDIYLNRNEPGNAFLIDKAPINLKLIYAVICFSLGVFFWWN